MSVSIAERIRSIVDALPAGAAVSLPIETLREWLEEAAIEEDLELEEFAALVGVSVSTAREYCAAGLVPGAYKRRGRKWLIPRASVALFRERQQREHGPGASARRPTAALGRGRKVDTSAWRNY